VDFLTACQVDRGFARLAFPLAFTEKRVVRSKLFIGDEFESGGTNGENTFGAFGDIPFACTYFVSCFVFWHLLGVLLMVIRYLMPSCRGPSVPV
jgi:hypothetical protein